MTVRRLLLLLMSGCLLSAEAAPPTWLSGYRLRMELEVVSDKSKEGQDVVQDSNDWVMASLPTGGWCRPDGADIQIQDSNGQILPVEIVSSDPLGSTILQFKPKTQATAYWAYMGSALTATAKRAFSSQSPTLEVRPYSGEAINSWTEATKVLEKSTEVDGSAMISHVWTYGNPFQWHRATNFIAVYRGFIKITKPGTYRFITISDDASFLFLKRQLVYERLGKREASSIITDWYEVNLLPGLLPFEYYHFSGSDARTGNATLAWKVPGGKWKAIPPDSFQTASFAAVRSVEGLGSPAVAFVWGVEDALISPEASGYLVRFQAHGNFEKPEELLWDFGDGTKGTGASIQHLYLDPGAYTVSLQTGNTPVFRQRIIVAQPNIDVGPLALREMVNALSRRDWKTSGDKQLIKAFNFVMAAAQPDQWKLQESLARQLLARPGVSPPEKIRFSKALLQALSEQGEAAEAIQIGNKMLAGLKSQGLRMQAKSELAGIQWRYLRDFKEATKQYEEIFEENQKVKRTELRNVAVDWGDMLLESGDLSKAEEKYRLAATLGGEQFAATGQVKAIGRGVLLRVAEQKLREGNLRESQSLLKQIETQYPEQKVEGLFRFLKAEVDRHNGDYKAAIENYQVLLKLSQWSGYRDRALSGMALCYNELGELHKASDLLEAVKKSFPEYFKDQQLGRTLTDIESRLVRGESGKLREDLIGFKGYTSAFDKGFKEEAELKGLEWAKGLGIFGEGVADIFASEPTSPSLKLQLDQIRPRGLYWVEIWYRDQKVGVVNSPTSIWYDMDQNVPVVRTGYNESKGMSGIFTISITGANIGEAPSKQTQSLDPSYGMWRKSGILVNASDRSVLEMTLRMSQLMGYYQFDGLRVLPVTEREVEQLRNFIQGDVQ